MTVGIETNIWLALKSGVEALPLGYKIAWPGQTFQAPFDASGLLPYLRVGRVSAAPRRIFVAPGQPHDRNGFLIVTLVYPLGQDVSVYDDIAANIASHFKDGAHMRFGNICVTVTDYPQVQEGYEDTGYWNVPVRISWKCYA